MMPKVNTPAVSARTAPGGLRGKIKIYRYTIPCGTVGYGSVAIGDVPRAAVWHAACYT